MDEKSLIEKFVDNKKYEIKGGYTIEKIWNSKFEQIAKKTDGVYFVVGKREDIESATENVDGAISKITITHKNGKTETKDVIYKDTKLTNLNKKLEMLKKSSKDKNEDSIILYIGSATRDDGNGIQERLKEYIGWGYGSKNNHKGGRAIWQIPNCKKNLRLYWIELEDKKTSKNMEAVLINRYYDKYGSIPFANMKREKIKE